MKNWARKFSAFLIIAVGIFTLPNLALAFSVRGAFNTILGLLGKLIFEVASFIAILGGVALNASVHITVVKMTENFGQIEPAINIAWTVIRDVANMGFIFVLLWASIKLILGMDDKVRELIVNMVIAAILINFSLFFTKVVIDVANLLAITFYSAIADPTKLADYFNAGISTSMASALKLSSILKSGSELSGPDVLMISVLSAVVLLISAFVFFAAAIMFIIRYVVLMFVLILSPIAFVSNVLPGLSDTAKKWKDALIGQAFFAPIYFLLMIVTIKVAQGISTSIAGGGEFGSARSADPAFITTLINFGIITGFLITSLVIAKQWADKAPSAVGKMTKWAMGAAGGATLGVGGRLGRSTLGRAGAAIADSDRLKDAADRKGFGGAAARLALATGKRAGSASFDARSSRFYEGISEATDTSFGKSGGKDGFQKILDDKRKEEVKMAESRKTTITSAKVNERVIRDRRREAQERYDQERAQGKAGAKDRYKQAIKDAESIPVTETEQSEARKAIGVNNNERMRRFADRMETPQSFQFQTNKKSGGPRYGREAAEEIRKKFKHKSPAQQIEDAIKGQVEEAMKNQSQGQQPPQAPPPGSPNPPTP